MAEIQRVGGHLESLRGPAGRRALLPSEAELCNAVGLTEEEYWHFVELTDAYAPDETELRNDPVSLVVSLVIGAALSAVSAMMAPKPKQQEQKQPQNLSAADVKGRSRFAPQSGFDSLQELATLGMTVPLVFTRKGVRVNGTLLWSQMVSLGNGQQFRGIMLFSSGNIEGRPDFAGYAIGDTLLENYTNAKLALYFRGNGGRIGESSGERYGEGSLPRVPSGDAFTVYWDRDNTWRPYFSGARTPNVQTQFGCYAPVPNGMMYRPTYDHPVIPDGDKDTKERLRTKRNKARDRSPYRAAIIKNNGEYATYRLDGSEDSGDRYRPWGSEDIKQSQNSARESADSSLSVGSQYLIGSALAIGHSIPADPWVPGYTKDCTFRIIEGGAIQTAGVTSTYGTADRLTLQSVAIATVSNNRACSVTEIGLKSTVWNQVNGFANLNGHPGDGVIDDMSESGGSFSYGSMSKHLKRLSFFELQVRKLGENSGWTTINGGSIFCIKGRTPQAQYNWIRISHPFGQWEFRLRPVAGNEAKRSYLGRSVYQLRQGRKMNFSSSGFGVAFEGKSLRLDATECSNPEWIVGKPPATSRAIRSVASTQKGSIPIRSGWQVTRADVYVSSNDGMTIIRRQKDGTYKWFWGGGFLGNSKTVAGNFYIESRGARYYAGKQKYTTAWSITEKKENQQLPPSSVTTVGASGGSGSGATFKVERWSNGAARWALASGGNGYWDNETVRIPGANASVRITTDASRILENNWNPWDAISDYPLVDAESKSHMDGPEHEIVYVNEQVEQATPHYDKLAIAGIRINSTKEWTAFNSLSAYFKRGIRVNRIYAGGNAATNLMPEIAYALLTDPVIGAGNLISTTQVDDVRMATAAKFCAANNFTWDGVISEKLNLREWIYENAGYCLLDFTILGGRFSLVPSVPMHSNGKINFGGKPDIKALFTDGNIRDMKVSFLGPEERQLFKASVLWRQEQTNGFPETRTINIRLSNAQGGSDSDPQRSFDMSGFCTSQHHAETFAKYALKLQKEVDHGVTFLAPPSAAMNLQPGQHFRLVSEVTHTSRFNNGSIGPDGSITSADQLNGNYSILYWEPGTTGVKSATLTASNNKTNQGSLFGTVFTINNSTTVDRVYKCETLTYADDGLVEIAGSHEPLTSSGSLAVLNWGSNDFVLETG